VKRTLILIGLFIAIASGTQARAATSPQQPNDPAITASQAAGEITEINSSAGRLTVKTAGGSVIAVNVTEKTTYQRVPPGETSLANAVPSALTELTVGDRIVARGFVAEDRKSVPAQKIYVISQSDIAKRNAAQRMAWARGTKGIVSAINATTKEATVTSRSMAGTSQAVTVAIPDSAKLKRYPADAVPKYEIAKAAKFDEIKVGDQLNARGEKSADGLKVTAEEVVFGTFKIAGGTVTAVDAAANTVTINDLQTKKPTTIVLKPETVVRKFVMMMGGGPGGPGGTPPAGAAPGGSPPAGGAPQRPASQNPGGGAGPQGPRPGGPGGPGGPGAGMTMADVIDRLPTIAISEIKVGDMIIMSTLPGADQNRLTAVSMLTGVEPLLTMIAQRQAAGGQPRPQSVDLQGNFGGMFGGIGP
jgi:hypothetical protein